MSRKKLIAIGCSYTEHYKEDPRSPGVDFNFSRWPQILADKLDMDCVNLGRCGMGNEYISAKLIDTVLAEKKEDIGLVVLMWSGWLRIDFQDIKGEWIGKFSLIRHNPDKYFDFWGVGGVDNYEYNMTMKSLRHFLIAQMLLNDIPYLMIQGVWTAFDWSHQQMAKTFINSKIFYEIDEDKFIGWPILQEIGGYNVNTILNKFDPERNQLRISDEDRHPNDEGHKILAREIYDAYEKIYT